MSLLSRTARTSVRTLVAAAVLVALAPVDGSAQAPTEGTYLYNVKTVRATPGEWLNLIDTMYESFEMDERAGDHAPFLIRHSQGDQWDFMLIYPMGDLESYFSPSRNEVRSAAWSSDAGSELLDRMESQIAYQEEWFANSVDVEEMTRRFEGMDFYHIEMFAGLPGQRDQLLEQRRMENRYYEHLNRQQNLIFTRQAGTNWDAMTIGFYENIQAFANAGAASSAEDQDEAARVAGFDGVDHISPLLRSLMSYHHDTLGVRAR